jgi:hypothetical protein
VLALVPPHAPGWLRDGRFLDTPRLRPPTGATRTELGAGNVLLTASLAASFDAPFDESLNTVGGEDSVFFRAAHLHGRKLVWADRAIVYEHVPPERLTLHWVLRRAAREGAIVVLRNQLLEERKRAVLALRSLALVAAGVTLAIGGAVTGRSVASVAGLRRAADGAGRLLAFTGRIPQHYPSGHGVG